jgi:uncharacterized protein (TIGR00304 family)
MENRQLAGTDLLSSVGIALIFAGALIVILAVLLLSIRSAGNGKVRADGAVILGPIPIIFGTDKKSLKTVMLLSILLTILLLVVMIVNYLLSR